MKQLQRFGILCITLSLASCVSTKVRDNLQDQVATLEAENASLAAKNDSLRNQLTTDMEDIDAKRSYAMGVQVASGFAEQGTDTLVVAQDVANGLRAGIDNVAEMDQTEAQEVLRAYQMELMQAQQQQSGGNPQQQAQQQQAAAENKAKGEKFLKENAQRKEVTELESGLQYEVIEEGDGKIPEPTDKVKAHYKGMFIDGKVFDSSYERGEPFTTKVTGNIIKGWQQALQRMPVGAKWKIYLPSDLAYGPRGNQGIPGNATLIFELEVLEIVE